MFWGGADRAAAIVHAWLLTRSDGPWRVHHEVTLPGQESSRADIWALRVSWSRLESWIFEVKVSRSDFRKDVDQGKYRKYLPHCSRFFWAVPKDLVKKDEVPEGTGLLYVGGGVEVAKRSEIRKWVPSWQQLAGLLFSLETPLVANAWVRRSPSCLPPPAVSLAHDQMLYDEKHERRQLRKKKVEEYLKELEGRAKGLRDLEQLRADTYVLERKMAVVRRVLGIYGDVNENELGAALERAKTAGPMVHVRLKQLAQALGCDVVEKPRAAPDPWTT